MRKIKQVMVFGLALYTLGAWSLGLAQEPGPQEKEHFKQHIEAVFKQLDLTDEQRKQLDANKEKHHGKMDVIRQEMKQDRESMKAELMKPQLDMPKVMAIHGQIKALQSQMEDNKLDGILGVRSILTPAQFAKFVTLMGKHRPDRD